MSDTRTPPPEAQQRLIEALDGLIAQGDPGGADAADRLIWEHLGAIDGLSAQAEAAAALDAALTARPDQGALMEEIRARLARHRARLAEPSA